MRIEWFGDDWVKIWIWPNQTARIEVSRYRPADEVLISSENRICDDLEGAKAWHAALGKAIEVAEEMERGEG